MLTPEQALEKARQIIEDDKKKPNSEPKIHYDLDELLCEILRPLGYSALVDLYHEQTRWFE
jgi:hypothetical protein